MLVRTHWDLSIWNIWCQCGIHIPARYWQLEGSLQKTVLNCAIICVIGIVWENFIWILYANTMDCRWRSVLYTPTNKTITCVNIVTCRYEYALPGWGCFLPWQKATSPWAGALALSRVLLLSLWINCYAAWWEEPIYPFLLIKPTTISHLWHDSKWWRYP